MEDKKFSTEGLRVVYNAVAEQDYYINAPTAEDIRGADWEYSKSYTKSLVAGITTTAEMTDILMRRGIIGPEFEQRSNELSDDLAVKIEALSGAKGPEDKASKALEVATAREELFQWSQRLNAPLGNTCEQISDDARLEFLTSRIIVDDKGATIWESYDNYLTEKNQSLAQQARFEVMLYLQGLESDFLDSTPEAIAMKEIEQDAVAELAEEAAQVVKAEEAQAKAKAKARAKKSTAKKPATKKSK